MARAALLLNIACFVLVSCRGGRPPSSDGSAPQVDDAAADAAMADGRWQAAVDLHRDLLREDPENGLAMYHLGFSEGSLGRHREEAAWYEKALSVGFKSPDLLYNLGLARLELGELVAADSALAQALRGSPDEAEFHYAAARVALAQGDDVRAREHLQRTTSLDPNHREGWEALAALHERTGDRRAAAAARARAR